MTTLQTNTVIDHTGDVPFRTWITEVSNSWAAVGLVQTADTGQINLATATRPSTNANAGYQIWRFNDTLQATKPIFIRIQYGTAYSAAVPRMQVIVGTGSDGAGNLTNPTAVFNITASATPTSTVTNYLSDFSCSEGFFGMAWKIGSTSSVGSFFAICRSVDSDGNPDATGFSVYAFGGTGGTATEQLRFRRADDTWNTIANGVGGSSIGSPTCLIPGNNADSTFVGADAQVYLHFGQFPRMLPIVGLVGVKAAEFGADSTFTAAAVGSTPRTYLVLGGPHSGAGSFVAAYPSTTPYTIAMLWE